MAQRSLNRRSRRDDIEDDEYEGPGMFTDDDEDDEPPRRGRGRGRSRREEPEEAPRGRRSRREEPDDEDEDDEEDKPRSRRGNRDSFEKGSDEGSGRSHQRPNVKLQKGWGGYKEARKSTRSTDYIENYKLPETAELIKFLDDEPFVVYNEHWIDEARKKSWACIGDDCPLCNIGDKAKTYAMLNVIDLRDGEEPQVAPLKAGPMVADLLEEFANDKKTSPLTRDDLYFSIQKKGGGKKGRVQVILNPVKARDLKDDWDVDPLDAAEVADLKGDSFTEEDVVTYASRKTLKDVADELD